MSDEQETETTEDAVTPQERFAEALADLQEKTKPAETEMEEADAGVEDAAETEVEETPAEATPKVEGPTVAMKAFAKQQGLKDKVIALATSDEQLRELLEEHAASREPEPAKEPEKAPELEFFLPEDEFSADDPVRKSLVAIKEFYDKKLDEVYDYMGLMAKEVVDFQKVREETELSQLATVQGAFDAELDSYEHPSLGSRKDGQISEDHQTVREAIYGVFCKLQDQDPDADPAKLRKEAAAKFGFKPKSQTRAEAIKEASNGRLGGGPSKGLPEPTLSGRALAESLIEQALARKS